MGEMIEKVARAICHSYGSRMVGPGVSHATRESGWRGDGAHMDTYVERHWKEWINEATFAIEAMREPTEKMLEKGDHGTTQEGWNAMIEEALK